MMNIGKECRVKKAERVKFQKTIKDAEIVIQQEGLKPSTDQKLLGHENRTTTELYLHSLNQLEHEAISIYEQAR